jgi:DNA-directed RNA polymerase specialized sigma24 family protein
VEDIAGTSSCQEPTRRDFDSFFTEDGARLRRALVATYGPDIGTDVTEDALAWAWEHWARVQEMANPVGYLYRVGQSAARRHHRWQRPLDLPPEVRFDADDTGPGLDLALAYLTAGQRAAVLCVHGYGWTYAETAEALSVSVIRVRNDLHRGMKRLRRDLERS